MNNKGIFKGLSQGEQNDLEEVARDMGLSIDTTVDGLITRFHQMFPQGAEMIRNEALRSGNEKALDFKTFNFDRTES